MADDKEQLDLTVSALSQLQKRITEQDQIEQRAEARRNIRRAQASQSSQGSTEPEE